MYDVAYLNEFYKGKQNQGIEYKNINKLYYNNRTDIEHKIKAFNQCFVIFIISYFFCYCYFMIYLIS